MAGKVGLLMKLWESDDFIPFNLHTAASLGCLSRVHEITQEPSNSTILNEQTKDGWTPLMFAAYLGRTEVVSMLLNEGAQTNIKNPQEQTAVMLAVKCGNRDAASLIIDHGADIDVIDLEGWTALSHAVAANHRNTVKLLLDKGCRTNIIDLKGFTPLMIAAQAGHEMIVKDLLEKGACPLLSGKDKQSAKSLAVEKGFTNVQKLIDAHLTAENNNGAILGMTNLCSILDSLSLSKYYPVFEKNNIDWNTFRNLTNNDLKELGIGLLGPRKKILAYLLKHQEHKTQTAAKEQQEKEELLKKYEQNKLELADFKKKFADERRFRAESERRLSESLIVSKRLSEKMSKNAAHGITLLQVLRKALDKHQSILLCSPEADHLRLTTSNWSHVNTSLQNIDSIFNEICMNTRDLLI